MPSNTRPNQYEVKRGSDVIFKGYPTYHGSYMKPCYIEFTNVSVPAPLDLKVGDGVNYTRLGETFKLYEIPEPKKQASSNQSGEAYVYDSIKFYDAAKVLEIALFRNLVENGQYHFSSDAEVSITTNVAGVAGMIQECLSSYAGDSTWSVYLYNDATMQSAYETAVAKDYSASGTCMNALDALSELWNGIGWVYRYINNVHTIIIGYPNVVATTAGYADNNRTMRFAMGSGLRNIKCTPAPIGDFCTRLYPFGSDRNMITGYYQNNTDVYQHASCYIKHLMLPLSEWGITDGKRDASKAFIRSTDLETEFGVIPKEIRFDGSGDYPEVYPSIEKVTAKNIRDAKTALEHTDYVPNATIYPDATRMDTIKAITMPTDDGTASSDGDKYTDKTDQTIATTPSPVTATIHAGGGIVFSPIITGTIPVNGIAKLDLSDIECVITSAADIEITGAQISISTPAGKSTSSAPYSFMYQIPTFTGRMWGTSTEIGTRNNPVSGDFTIQFVAVIQNNTQQDVEVTISLQNKPNPASSLVIHWARKIVIEDTFNIKLKQIGFDMKARAVQCGSSPVISMKSGMCAGREFSVVTKSVQYDASDDSWTMTLQRVKDESVGMVYPNTNYPIAVGDEFVILEIEMPEEYIHMASSRLSELANAAFSKLSSTIPTYEPELDSKYIYIQQSAATPLENTFLRVGKWMWLSDANVIGATDINVLISSLTINEGESNIPTFKVSLVEFKRTGVVTQTQKQVVMLASEVSTMQTAQRAAMRDYNSGDVGGGGTATGGNSVLPVYMDNGEAFPIEGLEVDGNIISTAGGVSAKGLCDLSIHTSGGGGGGTWGSITGTLSDQTDLWSALSSKQATISDLETIRTQANNGNTAYGWGDHADAGYLTSASNVAWGKLTGVPTSFTPSAHTHAIGDVTGLQSELDGKQANLPTSGSAYDISITGNAETATTAFNFSNNGSIATAFNSINTALAGKANTSHLYHPWTKNVGYYEPYTCDNNMRMVTESMLNDILRFQAYSLKNVQYWNYDSSASDKFVAWTENGAMKDLSNLFDGCMSEYISIPLDKRKFRFEIKSNSGWPSDAMFVLQGTWFDSGTITPLSGSHYIKVDIETKSNESDAWAVTKSFYFDHDMCGFNSMVFGDLHTGNQFYRITIELPSWSKSANTCTLYRICILSNFSGKPLAPFTFWSNRDIVPIQHSDGNDLYKGGLGKSWRSWKHLYVDGASLVSGLLTCDRMQLNGIENSSISSIHNGDSQITNIQNKELASIREALSFKWYSTDWQIGNIRDNNSDSLGFGITKDNSYCVFRVNENDAFVDENVVYHAGNANKNTVDWTCQNLTMNGTLTGATTGSFSDAVSTGELTVTGSIIPSYYLHLNNGRYITFKDSNGTRRNTFQVNSGNHVVLGFGFSQISGSNTEIWYSNELRFGHNNSVIAGKVDSSNNLSMNGGISAKGIGSLSPDISQISINGAAKTPNTNGVIDLGTLKVKVSSNTQEPFDTNGIVDLSSYLVADSGWTQFYSQTVDSVTYKAYCRKIGKVVHLKGSAVATNSGSSSVFCTLPSGYYCSSEALVIPTNLRYNATVRPTQINIQTDGQIYVSVIGSASYSNIVYLTGISFLID